MGCPFGEQITQEQEKFARDEAAAIGKQIGTFDEDLESGRCTKEGLQSWLDSPNMKGVISTQHQWCVQDSAYKHAHLCA